MLDLFDNYIAGFLMTRLICIFSVLCEYLQKSHCRPSDAGILLSLINGVSPMFSSTLVIMGGLGFLKISVAISMSICDFMCANTDIKPSVKKNWRYCLISA